MSRASIAVVLPPRERFRPADAGAIALTVKDFVGVSQYLATAALVVLGRETQPFPDVPYVYVPHSLLGRVLGTTKGYAYDCCQWLSKNTSIVMVEVHNRIELALHIKRRFPHLKVCVHLHNDPHTMEGAKTATQRQRMLSTLDAIYCVSDYVRTQLLGGVSEYIEKVHVIYNALSVPQSVIESQQEKQPCLVYVGRFIPEKGVLELAQALAVVLPNFPQWQAVFLGAWGFGHTVGKSNYEQDVYAALAQVSTQVDFRGHVAQADVMQTLATSSIVVVPSVCGEAFGRVALEAMSMANAVVVSSFGALPEVAGSAAIILPEVNQVFLINTLTELMANPAKVKEIAFECQQRAIKQFNVLNIIKNLDSTRALLLKDLEGC